MTRQTVVLFGASNLVLGWHDLIHTLRKTIDSPVDLQVAMGMGRSYLTTSSFLFRRLPAIDSCGLWDHLPQNSEIPPCVLITDLGNDIVYSFKPDQIAAAVRDCLQRILDWRSDARIVITGLPLASVASVGQLRFKIARSILFPGCSLSLSVILERARTLEHLTRELAAEFSVPMAEPEPQWYGLDPIHVVPKYRKAAFAKYFAPFGYPPLTHVTDDEPTAAPRIKRPTAAESIRFGSRRTVKQPVFQTEKFIVSAW